MKKFYAITAVLLVMVMLAVAGCSSGSTSAPKVEPKWTIAVEGAGDKTQFTDIDADKAGIVTIKATIKKKDGTETEQEWTGVPLKKLLESLGVKDYSTIKVESKDGYFKEITPDLINSDGTVLGFKVDGSELDGDSGPVQLVINGKGANWWVKQVAKVTVVK